MISMIKNRKQHNDETHILFFTGGEYLMKPVVNTFTVMGFIVTICVVLFVLWIVICFIAETAKTIYRMIKTKYMIKHRFDKPPVAKCYCLYCKYAEYFGDDRCGKCRLIGDNVTIKDNGFCWNADPKK